MWEAETITLRNWRNFELEHFQLPAESAVLLDANGSGKTSLLAAVYALFTGQPWPGTRFLDHLRAGQEYFGIQARDASWNVLGRISPSGRLLPKYEPPEIQLPKLITYIPTDNLWLSQSRSAKLGALDELLGQMDPKHVQNIRQLDKVVRSKTQLIRHQQETEQHDPILGEQLTRQVSELSQHIWAARVQFLQLWQASLGVYAGWVDTPLKDWRVMLEIADNYGRRQRVSLEESQGGKCLAGLEELEMSRLWALESRAGRVLYGAQRDDFGLEAQHRLAQHVLSRGEMRLLVLFTKHLAVQRLLNQQQEVTWLLDDVFNELDSVREQYLFAEVLADSRGFLATSTQPPAFVVQQMGLKDLTIPRN